jgi:site-specific DNA-methyltransferase (adenine-specific)
MTGAMDRVEYDGSKGRWPANVVLDESQAAALDAQSGETSSAKGEVSATKTGGGSWNASDGGAFDAGRSMTWQGKGDTGGASRFFYTAKAASEERVRIDGTAHPTVKPLALMRWLVRLVTPPGGTVLEPFAGSGTTVEACILEGFRCVAIEREADYLPLITQRINRRRDPVQAVAGSGEDPGLFELL